MSLFSRVKNLLDFDGVAYRAYQVSDEIGSQLVHIGGAQMPTKQRPYHTVPALPFHTQKLSKLPLTWTPQAATKGRLLITEANERLALSKATDSALSFDGFGLELHPYQKAGVEYMMRAKRVLLGDAMGLGKTAQALAFMWKEPDAFPALVITPASLKYWWKQEGERCLPGKRFVVLDSKFKPLEIQMADVVIVNYDILAAGWENPDKKQVKLSALGEALLAHPFKSIFLEEAHAVKNHSAQRTKAVRKLAEGKLIRVAITGTPVTNRPSELAPMLQVLGRLNDLGGWGYFMKRYCRSPMNRFNQFGGSHNEIELHERMRASFYIRRTKDDVQLELPPLTRSVVPLEIDNREEYKFAEQQLIAWVKEQAAKDEDFKKSIMHLDYDEQLRLIEDYKNNKAARAKRAEAIVKIGALKRITARGKLKQAQQWVNELLDNDEKLLLFATGREVIGKLQASYPHALAITSDMLPAERTEAVKSFQSNGCNLLVGAFGTSAGSSPAGTGLTMTAAANVAFLELGWTSAHHDQAEARIWRMGQQKACTAYYLIARDTIEQKIMRLIDGKRAITGAITDGKVDTSQPPLIDLLLGELAAS